MAAHDSVSSRSSSTASQEVRTVALDEIDRRVLNLLQQDARMPNNALAAAVGIAPSTCLARVRTLRAAGVIRGFHAEVDPAALGRGLQAMVAVRMQSGARNRLSAFAQRLAARSEVLDLYFLAGADDFLVHVAVEDSDALREFVLEQLSAFPEVALTETSLIFEHIRTSSARSR
ncbi:leucine-responsive regulatory protein [mine drainage metagenome]|uniref:Leucine-responsive regulatory protein n=1 Tax=mine drainage metagenome TaxID=410659 RepID=A0A1J5RTE2_9ZZZZ